MLLRVLETRFGIAGDVLRWMESYLRPRYLAVQVPGCTSHSLDITFSVPQGSCLGPVLFSAYSSTLVDIIPEGIGVRSYADDHGLALAFSPQSDSESLSITTLEHCCRDIINLMNYNRLKINTSKTEFVCFGTSAQQKKCAMDHITVCDSIVPRSSCVKYLGVILDHQLSLKDHIMQDSHGKHP